QREITSLTVSHSPELLRCAKIKKSKVQETKDTELNLFILEEGAKGLLKELRSKYNDAYTEEETVSYQNLKNIKKDLEV
ncbi:18006_t:CDS:1, partial [Gigaspora rosea]